MADMPTCKTCPHWFEKGSMCLRFPPQVMAWKNPAPRTPEEEIVINSKYPEVNPHLRCGEHPEMIAKARAALAQADAIERARARPA